MSKIRKISLIRKNWILNGIRLLDNGSNPHSKGEDFSRLVVDFFERRIFIRKKRLAIIVKKIIRIINKIIYINLI